MRGTIPLRLLHQLGVVFHAGAKQPLVNLRLLEHQRLALLVVGDCVVIDPTVHGRWSWMRRQISAIMFIAFDKF